MKIFIWGWNYKTWTLGIKNGSNQDGWTSSARFFSCGISQWTDHTQNTQPFSSLSLNRISELCHGFMMFHESNLRSQKIFKKVWYFDELVKQLLHGISGDVLMLSEISYLMLVRNCISFPAISPANPSGHKKKLAKLSVLEGIHGTGDPGLPTWARWEGWDQSRKVTFLGQKHQKLLMVDT